MKVPITTVILERCAQTIEQVIMPNLAKGVAPRQAQSIAILLRNLAPLVGVSSELLREENQTMREVLERVLEALRKEKALSQNAVGNRLIERLDYELKKGEGRPPDIGEENENLKGALVATIEGLDTLTEELPSKTMSSLRQKIRFVLRQQLDHGIEQFSSRMPVPGEPKV